jgi:hypothetical protein
VDLLNVFGSDSKKLRAAQKAKHSGWYDFFHPKWIKHTASPTELTMNSKICLLLTDDPDDQQSFSNAISEIAPENILISVIDANHAVKLLSSQKIHPDFVFVDVSMYGLDVSKIRITTNREGAPGKVPLALYGYEEDSGAARSLSDFPYLNKDCTYSDLINFIRSVLHGS